MLKLRMALVLLVGVQTMVGCVDMNFLKSLSADPQSAANSTNIGKDEKNSNEKNNEKDDSNDDDNSNDQGSGYTYSGSCKSKIKLVRSSTLAPELKDGDAACVEYSPKAYQGADSTGATIVIVSATWCNPCTQFKSQYPALLDAAEKHKATVKVILQDGTDSVARNYGLPDFFMSRDLRAFETQYGRVPYFPYIVLIDKNGNKIKTLNPNVGEIEAELEKL
jgi:hypothetical protein